jgi:DNA replication licensing factor MCM3
MAPPGLLPMSVQVVLQNSLVGSVKPGDRVQATGVYVARNDIKTILTGIFKCSLVCLNVNVLHNELTTP